MAVSTGEPPSAAAYSQAVEFRVLGPIEYVNGGSPTPLGSPKQRAVLGMLLQSAGNVVTTDSLIQGVWGEDGSDTSRNSLHTYISNLRAIIGGRIERTGKRLSPGGRAGGGGRVFV